MRKNANTHLLVFDIFERCFLLLFRELNELRGINLHNSFGRLFKKREFDLCVPVRKYHMNTVLFFSLNNLTTRVVLTVVGSSGKS